MDTGVSELLAELAAKTDSFESLAPHDLNEGKWNAAQVAAALLFVGRSQDASITGFTKAAHNKCSSTDWALVWPLLEQKSFDWIRILRVAMLLGGSDAAESILQYPWKSPSTIVVSLLKLNAGEIPLPPLSTEETDSALNLRGVPRFLLSAAADPEAAAFAAEWTASKPRLFLLDGLRANPPSSLLLSVAWPNFIMKQPSLAEYSELNRINPQFVFFAFMDQGGPLDVALNFVKGWVNHGVAWLGRGYVYALDLVAALEEPLDALTAFTSTGPESLAVLLAFMDLKLAETPPILSLKFVAAFESLTASVEMPPDRLEQLKSIQIHCLQAFPRLINFGQGHDEAILANQDLPAFPLDVETGMKAVFQQMYEGHLEIRDVIAMLERLKDSDEPHDQDLFACMIHSLFDECRFFPNYPVNALATTAVLFGSLVHFRLIDKIPLSIAMRFILESLRQPIESNMFRFGLQALFELRRRLPEFPKYCSVLLAIPGLASQQQFYQQIKKIVEPVTEQPTTVVPGLDAGSLLVIVEPPEQTRDKIFFVLNNLTSRNAATKATELAQCLSDERTHAWLSRYLVTERAAQEPNNQALYLQVLETLPMLIQFCLRVTYAESAKLLSSQEVLSSESRTKLKNLGSFLGGLTLARKRPPLHINFQPKVLLSDAYYRERLPAVLPFICRILAQAVNSPVFGPQTPWMLGILGVLSELYHHTDLRLNLKFEIEVLCSALGVQINDIEASDYVRNGGEPPEVEVERMNLLDQVPVGVPLTASGMAPPPPMITPAPAQAQMAPILQGSTDFTNHPALRPLLDLAVSKTMQEVLLPMVERSASIASFTSKELVSKDYALEPSEAKLKSAAHSLAGSLAASLALVSTKEPFLEALATNLRALIVQQGQDTPLIVDQIPIAAREHTELLTPFIEQTARDRATTEVDEALVDAYVGRQRHQPLSASDSATKNLPPPLSLQPGGLTLQQLAVYERFGGNMAVSLTPEPELAAGLQRGIDELSKLKGTESLEELDQDSLAISSVSHLSQIAQQAAGIGGDDVLLAASQHAVHALFASRDPNANLSRATLCVLLGRLCELSATTAKEVLLWLIYADDERRFNIPVMSSLLRAGLLTPAELDVTLCRDVQAGSITAQRFAAGIVLETVMGPQPCALKTDFAGSISALASQPDSVPSKILFSAFEKAAGGSKPSESELFAEWMRLVQHPAATPALLVAFVADIEPNKIPKTVRSAVEIGVASFAKTGSFVGVDAAAKFITTLSKDSQVRPLLMIPAFLLAKDHESPDFSQQAYFRLLSSIAVDLPVDATKDFAAVLALLQPKALPGFTSAWIALISHRFVLPRLLETGWPELLRLLVALFRFLGSIADPVVGDSLALTVLATERILLVIMHDEPEFLVREAIELVSSLTPVYSHLRNLILSAFPPGIELPPPAGPLPSALKAPEGASEDAARILQNLGAISVVDQAIRSQSPTNVQAIITALTHLKPRHMVGLDFEQASISPLGMNALAAYLAGPWDEEKAQSQLAARLFVVANAEGRYFWASALVNLLRFPSTHTIWTQNLVIALFGAWGDRQLGTRASEVRNIVARALMERAVANRPHPWGVMATLGRLMRDTSSRFWKMSAIKASPEIEAVFTSMYAHIAATETAA